MWGKGNTLALLVGVKIGAATAENSVKVPQNVKNSTTIRPNNFTVEYLPKENEITN